MSDSSDGRLPLTRRKILGALGVAGIAGGLGGVGTSSFFSDGEQFSNNQLVAGSLDMKVSWDEHYSDWSTDEQQAAPGARMETSASGLDLANETGLPTREQPLLAVPDANITAFMNATREERFPTGGLPAGADPCVALTDVDQGQPVITLSDVKPGDFGEVTFDFALCNNPGFVWLSGGLVSVAENGTTEPEAESPNEGDGVELLDVAQAAVWIDDGDNYQDDEFDDNGPETVIESGSLRTVLTTLSSDDGLVLTGDVPAPDGGGTGVNCFSATSVHYVGFAWWVPPGAGNEIQSDSVTFDLGFYTEQCRHNAVSPGIEGFETFASTTANFMKQDDTFIIEANGAGMWESIEEDTPSEEVSS